MATPHKCPVCNGQGKVQTPPWLPGDQDTWSAGNIEVYECRVCNGTGVIWERKAERTEEPDDGQ
jgi:DnaJ-class molecular chaperone